MKNIIHALRYRFGAKYRFICDNRVEIESVIASHTVMYHKTGNVMGEDMDWWGEDEDYRSVKNMARLLMNESVLRDLRLGVPRIYLFSKSNCDFLGIYDFSTTKDFYLVTEEEAWTIRKEDPCKTMFGTLK